MWRPVKLALLASLAWSGSLFLSGFSFDDAEILASPVVGGSLPWTAALDRDYWHHLGDAGHYRPLAVLSLRLDHALYGTWAPGYHLTNVLLHALVVFLLALWNRGAALGIALFAVHPALADSVAWVSGRTSMLAAAAGLAGACVLASSTRRATDACAAFLALTLALLAKEDAVVFALLYPVVRLSRGTLFGCALALGVWLAARAAALGAALPSAPNAPLAGAELVERLRVGGLAIVEGLRLSAAPWGYPPSYRVEDLGPARGALVPLLAWLFLALSFALGARARTRVGRSACFAALAALPVLQIVPAGEVFAPRFLYLPLCLGAPLVDAVFRRSVSGRLRTIAAALFIASGCALAWHRSTVYADRASYRQAMLAIDSRNAAAWNDVGIALEEQGRDEEAVRAWRRAVSIDPYYSRAWSNLGGAAIRAGELDRAAELLRRAVAVGPHNPVAHCNLGNVELRREAWPEAAAAYERATQLAPGMGAAWRGLGTALLRQGRLDEARAALDRALALDPDDEQARKLRARAE